MKTLILAQIIAATALLGLCSAYGSAPTDTSTGSASLLKLGTTPQPDRPSKPAERTPAPAPR